MHGRERKHEGQLTDKVPVAGGIEAVGGGGGKAEGGPGLFPVDRQAGASQGRRAQRHDVGAAAAVGQPVTVTSKLFAPDQQLMGCQHRLGPP